LEPVAHERKQALEEELPRVAVEVELVLVAQWRLVVFRARVGSPRRSCPAIGGGEMLLGPAADLIECRRRARPASVNS
jgi:hypothetical protein